MALKIFGAVPKWSKGAVCKTAIRRFESGPLLGLLAPIKIGSLCLLASSPVAAFEPLLASSAIAQGETLRILVDKVPEKAKVIAELDGKKIPFYPLSPGTQRALVGIGPNRAPQPTPLTIRWKRPFRPDRKKTLPLQVLAVSWPQSSIFMPPRKMGLLDDARRKQGRQRLAEVLKTETPQQNWTGKFLRPARGKIRSSFGKQRTLQTTGQERDWGQHRGVDIAAPKNTLVRASNRGQVIAAEPFVLEGRLIALNHGQGILSLYMHLAEFLVKPGEVVEKGAPIGRIGSEGFSTGSHLHWAIYVHGVPVNPLSWEKSEF